MHRVGHNVGSVVKELRELRALSQTELAKKAEVRQPFISKIEQGYQVPLLPTFIRLLSVLGAELVVLTNEEVNGIIEPGDSS